MGRLALLAVSALGACGKDAADGTADTGPATETSPTDPTATGELTTLTEVQGQVFTPSCAQSYCHDADAPSTRPRLTPEHAYGDLVNQGASGVPGAILVVPGEPTNSYLIMKLQGIPGIDGSQMPLGVNMDPLLITLVEKWILEGALDN
jgi:hypothetical protein